jgi:hypothetical protein
MSKLEEDILKRNVADLEIARRGQRPDRVSGPRREGGLGSVVDNETQNKCKKFLTIV